MVESEKDNQQKQKSKLYLASARNKVLWSGPDQGLAEPLVFLNKAGY